MAAAAFSVMPSKSPALTISLVTRDSPAGKDVPAGDFSLSGELSISQMLWIFPVEEMNADKMDIPRLEINFIFEYAARFILHFGHDSSVS